MIRIGLKVKRMIKLYLQAGLGNQLFQYAYARFLQSKYNEPIIIDTYCCDKGKQKTPHEACSLQKYKLQKDVYFESTKWSGIGYYALFLQKGILRKTLRLFHKSEDDIFEICAKMGIYASPNTYHFYPFVFTRKKKKKILGCWQNGHIWSEIEDEIRNELALKNPFSSKTKLWEKEISENLNSVCVHIRRGDYLQKRYQYLNVCDYDFYRAAMDIVVQKNPFSTFYLFSNNDSELDWIMANYDFEGLHVVPVYGSGKAEEDLYLISLCRNFIISNSTFGWWGQFLCRFPQKRVYAPSVWNPKIDDDGIYDRSWIKIECNKRRESV